MNSVLTDIELRDELVRKGRHRAREFSWDKNARETWAIIEEVAGS
jgi:glycosyltransferase involved in cell wall biosynthesis